jgi:cytochrome P450
MRFKIERRKSFMNNFPDASSAGVAPEQVFSPEMVENPFPLLAMLRTMGDVVPVPFPLGDGTRKVWMVTRLKEAVQVLKDDELFTVESSKVGLKGFFGQGDGAHLFSRSMLSVDEPDHRRLRRLVSKAFTPKYIQSLRPHIQQIADELLDKVHDQGQMDLVQDYGYPLPINVISDMLGVPSEDREQMRLWSEALAGGGPGVDEERDRRIRAFSEYVVQLLAEKRRNPQDDLISQLIQIEEEGDRLSEDELISMVSLLIFAGHETTSNLIGIGTLTLLDHPDQLARLKADPSLIPLAVEELLRFNGPVFMTTGRFATSDVELGGQHINQGDLIMVVLASADRDESQFTQADELDIARSLNNHVAFGQGIHICLGAPLARLEGDIAFTTLLRRMPNLRLNAPRESIVWRGGFVLRGVSSLPVAF